MRILSTLPPRLRISKRHGTYPAIRLDRTWACTILPVERPTRMPVGTMACVALYPDRFSSRERVSSCSRSPEIPEIGILLFPSFGSRRSKSTPRSAGGRYSLPEDDLDENPGMSVKYDRIGDTYDRTRRSGPRIADRLVSLLESVPGAFVLDIGCGTGNYASALAKRGLTMVGLDLSRTMLAMARAKHPRLPPVCADGAALPFAVGAFAHAVTALAIHHMADLTAAFSSVRRVVAKGGRYVIFSALPEQLEAYWLAHYFPSMMAAAVRACQSRSAVDEALSAVGFRLAGLEPWAVLSDLADMFLYAGKDRPELYLEEGFRNGISSFREFASAEVDDGLARLRADLDSGRWEALRARADQGRGDHCFLVAD